jgi:hypothetical protein
MTLTALQLACTVLQTCSVLSALWDIQCFIRRFAIRLVYKLCSGGRPKQHHTYRGLKIAGNVIAWRDDGLFRILARHVRRLTEHQPVPVLSNFDSDKIQPFPLRRADGANDP